MALKAGRVGLHPSQVDKNGMVIGGGGSSFLHGAGAPSDDIGNDKQLYFVTGGNLLQGPVSSESELTVTVTANSNWGGYDPWKAFTTSGWIGNGGNPHWLQIEFDAPSILSKVDFKSTDHNRSHAISRIGYSDDGENFTDFELSSSTMVNNVGKAIIANPSAAKYVRLYFDGSYSGSYYPMVSGLELYGVGDVIISGYAKVNGSWQDLIGTNINDII